MSLQSQINLFHTISLICLVIFIILLMISVFLFIKLDIRAVIGFLTGKTQRKTVEKMIAGEPSGSLDKSSKGKKKNKKHRNVSKKAVADTIMTPSGQLKKPGSDEVMLSTGSDITDVLGENAPTEERKVDGNVAGVQVGSSSESESDNLDSRKMTKPMGKFLVEKSIILVHTDEVIS